MQTISITISGKVQGVFFRQNTKEKAISLGITGLVKNLPGGNVYIIASGSTAQLKALVDWCRQGPPRANVTNIVTQEIALQEFNDFSIERH
ncbi:MAG: acylphosphatase [Chitinophagaceae bacterium]|nr:acylphosphatase [Chitinophagaceae bacterium]